MSKKRSQKKPPLKTENKRASSPSTCTYRVLGYQPLSVNMETQTIEGIAIQNIPCRISIRSAQADAGQQLQSGGSFIAIEFQADAKDDLIAIARRGLSLVEDFLSAIALVHGSTFQTTELFQVARLGAERADECEFLMFKRLPHRHWAKPITQPTITAARHLLAHWDGLEDGHRLRRAARQYREAIGNLDDTAAFQESYIGLECMEPPLAKSVGLQPGTEEVQGFCESCGHKFVRKKTSLVGLRAFVLNSVDPNSADTARKDDWKLISALRNDLMHGLIDTEKLADRPHQAILAAMHYLHASICIESHAPDLVSEEYALVRGGPVYLFIGDYKATSLPALHEWGPIIEITDFSWVPHEQYGFVPQVAFKNDGLKDLHIGVAQLKDPVSFATMHSVRATHIEHD